MRRLAALILSLAVPLSLVLTVCGGGGSPAGSDVSSSFAAAIADTPQGTTELDFHDRAAAARAAGVGDVGDHSSPSQLERYGTAMATSGGVTDLSEYLLSTTDSVFDELDVDWEMAGLAGPTDGGGRFQIFRLSDDIDLDRHLVVVNGDHSRVPVLDGSAPAAGDEWDGLTGALDVGTPLGLYLVDHPSCQLRAPGGASTAGLGRPSRTAYAFGTSGDQAVLQFTDAATARRDAQARGPYLGTGSTSGSQIPLSQLGSFSVAAHGDVVSVAITPTAPDRTRQLAFAGDGPLICGS